MRGADGRLRTDVRVLRLLLTLQPPVSDVWYEEDGWKLEGLCVTNDPFDTTYTTKPGKYRSAMLESVCGGCAVFDKCAEDADLYQVNGVWQAGEWRESPADSDTSLEGVRAAALDTLP